MAAARDFRLLFVAGTVFYLGAMVSYVALPYQLYHLTASNLLVGLVGVVELVPLVVFGLWGGAWPTTPTANGCSSGLGSRRPP